MALLGDIHLRPNSHVRVIQFTPNGRFLILLNCLPTVNRRDYNFQIQIWTIAPHFLPIQILPPKKVKFPFFHTIAAFFKKISYQETVKETAPLHELQDHLIYDIPFHCPNPQKDYIYNTGHLAASNFSVIVWLQKQSFKIIDLSNGRSQDIEISIPIFLNDELLYNHLSMTISIDDSKLYLHFFDDILVTTKIVHKKGFEINDENLQLHIPNYYRQFSLIQYQLGRLTLSPNNTLISSLLITQSTCTVMIHSTISLQMISSFTVDNPLEYANFYDEKPEDVNDIYTAFCSDYFIFVYLNVLIIYKIYGNGISFTKLHAITMDWNDETQSLHIGPNSEIYISAYTKNERQMIIAAWHAQDWQQGQKNPSFNITLTPDEFYFYGRPLSINCFNELCFSTNKETRVEVRQI